MKAIRLRGFTLVELIVVMLLSVLMVAACFSLLGLATSMSSEFSESKAAQLEIASFALTFERDLFTSTEIISEEEGALNFYSPDAQFSYVFSESKIEKNYLLSTYPPVVFQVGGSLSIIDIGYNELLKQSTAGIEIAFGAMDSTRLYFHK